MKDKLINIHIEKETVLYILFIMGSAMVLREIGQEKMIGGLLLSIVLKKNSFPKPGEK